MSRVIIDVDKFVEDLGEIFQDAKFMVQPRNDGEGVIVYGPFATLMFLLNSDKDANGFLVSLNADPSFISLAVLKLARKYPTLVHYGPYVEDIDGQGVHIQPDVLEKQHLLHLLRRVLHMQAKTQNEGSDAPKLILPDNKLVVAQ